MKKLGIALMARGVGLFMFNVLSWAEPVRPLDMTGARLGVAIGAMLGVGGMLLYRRGRS
jgi:hypothetical protein